MLCHCSDIFFFEIILKARSFYNIGNSRRGSKSKPKVYGLAAALLKYSKAEKDLKEKAKKEAQALADGEDNFNPLIAFDLHAGDAKFQIE